MILDYMGWIATKFGRDAASGWAGKKFSGNRIMVQFLEGGKMQEQSRSTRRRRVHRERMRGAERNDGKVTRSENVSYTRKFGGEKNNWT
jgi:plasmid stabilization system protein ParE